MDYLQRELFSMFAPRCYSVKLQRKKVFTQKTVCECEGL